MSDHDFKGLHQITGKRVFYNDIYRDKQAYESISAAKAVLLHEHPFWGFMGIDLVLVEVASNKIRTLATDGYHIFYSPRFINRLPSGQVEFAVAHEIYHCLYGHTSGFNKVNRRGDRDPKLWNKAGDYFINYDLAEAKIGEFITVIDILYDVKFADMSVEEIYEELVKNPPPDDAETLDVHFDFDTGGEGDGPGGAPSDGDEGDDEADGGKTITISEAEAEQEAERWKNLVCQAAAFVENHGNGAGDIPAGIRRLIEELNKPKIHWKSVLRRFVTSVIRTGYSFSRPDRKTFNSGITLPGFRRTSQSLDIVVAIDTSGSIYEDTLSKFLSELLGILSAFPSFKVHVFCFDGEVDPDSYKLIQRTTRGSPQTEIMNYVRNNVTGGGGTMFQSIWDFLRSRRLKPKGLVVLTDGYPFDVTWHNEGEYCPTMFLTVGNEDGFSPPFGKVIPFEEAA